VLSEEQLILVFEAARMAGTVCLGQEILSLNNDARCQSQTCPFREMDDFSDFLSRKKEYGHFTP
jgi:hypothetical protein